MRSRWIVPLLCWSAVCFGQVTGRFYLQKSTYAVGEPVYLYFEVRNDGPESQTILRADPYSFCSGYQVRVSTDPGPNNACGPQGFAGSCLSSSDSLASGKSHTERILINYRHKLDKPGDYDIDAIRKLPYAEIASDFYTSPKNLELHSQLHVRIESAASVDQAVWKGLASDLQSADPAVRRDAARTLATLAPPSMEATLLEFAHKEEFMPFAPLALHNLNTPRSMAALAEMVVHAKPGTYEHMEGARYLAESGDPRWFPLLREIGRANPKISNYLTGAAQSGGDKAIPLLLELLQSPDKEFTAVNAVSALGYTGSAAAVPILLDYLRNPDDAISQRALYGLRQLTHMQFGGENWPEHPQSQYQRWVQWWSRSQATAHIYKAGDCGEFTTLP